MQQFCSQVKFYRNFRFGADGGIGDMKQNLPIHYAVIHNYTNIVDLLLNKHHVFKVSAGSD